MAAVSLLSTRGLTKTFGGVTAVSDVDVELETGGITALIGPNGAGKSTLVGMLCGRIPASGGHVFFDGESIDALAAHQRIALGIAYTFQITSVFAGLSLWENVALAARRRLGKDKASVQVEVARALDRVGLADRTDQIAADQSYGHQRLLEIAMGLAQKPRLFILDEPTQGLAESEISNFVELITSLSGQTTILLIEHNMDVVMKTAERIIVMNAGEVLATGAPDDIRMDADVQAAYLGRPHA